MLASALVWEGLCVQGGVKGLGHSLRSQMPAASREGVQDEGDSTVGRCGDTAPRRGGPVKTSL